MHNDAIIFDIDGTLWNSCPAVAAGWNMGLAKLGVHKKVTAKQIESVAGHPPSECIDILLPGMRKKYPELLVTFSGCTLEAVRTNGGKIYPGVIRGIKKLATQYKIFLVSNCEDWYLNLFLDFSGLKSTLTGWDCYGLSMLTRQQMLSKTRSNFDLVNSLYVGDTMGDEQAAKEAKMEFAHVTYGFGPVSAGARSFNSFDALVGYMMNLANYSQK
ncbi:MAG: HAD hydrolase-like protein [bacterium]|nr:HAD hydrolase-like protein [bacterium]